MVKLSDGVEWIFETGDPALYNGNSVLCFCSALIGGERRLSLGEASDLTEISPGRERHGTETVSKEKMVDGLMADGLRKAWRPFSLKDTWENKEKTPIHLTKSY